MARETRPSRGAAALQVLAMLASSFLFLACSPKLTGAGATEAVGGTTAESSANGSVSVKLDTEDWTRVKVAFSTLSTIAGKGASDDSNEWELGFEGGPAIAAELSRPHMAMADASGNVYIADKESHAVRKVAPDGKIYTVAGTNAAGCAPDTETPASEGALSSPNGLWVNPDGTFYVLDFGNARVKRVSPSGLMSTLIVMDSLPVGRGLWVAEDESEALIAAGSELRFWTKANGIGTLASGFGALGMVVKTKAGRILAGDRDGLRVYEVATDGTKTVIAGDGTGREFIDGGRATEIAFDEPRAIWPYGDGLLVGLHDGCRIIYVDNEGYAHLMLRGSKNSHAGDGAPYDPTRATIGEVRSVTVDSSGDLIFVENDVGLVRRVAAAE